MVLALGNGMNAKELKVKKNQTDSELRRRAEEKLKEAAGGMEYLSSEGKSDRLQTQAKC